MARPSKSGAALNVDAGGMPPVSKLWAPSGRVSSRCRRRVPAGSSTMPVRLGKSGKCGGQVVNRRKTRQAECLPHLVRATSDHLNGNRREAAPAQAHANLMRSRLHGIGQDDVELI